MTPVNQGTFSKNGPTGPAATNGQPVTAPGQSNVTGTARNAVPVTQQGPSDPVQNGMGMENFGMVSISSPDKLSSRDSQPLQTDFQNLDLSDPMNTADVLNDFDFDSFLHDGDGDNQPFDFNGTFSGMEGGEIGAE